MHQNLLFLIIFHYVSRNFTSPDLKKKVLVLTLILKPSWSFISIICDHLVQKSVVLQTDLIMFDFIKRTVDTTRLFVYDLGYVASSGGTGVSTWAAIHYEDTVSWWRHQMEAFSALLALCAGNSPITGEFPAQRSVMRSFDVFFDLRLNKRLNQQLWGWWDAIVVIMTSLQCYWYGDSHYK